MRKKETEKKMEAWAAIYIRVSTDAQAEEGYSIDAQKEALQAYCVMKGIKNYKFYIDGGWSGSNIDRPMLQEMIRDCNNGYVTHCIVYKLDRLSRSQKDTLYLIEDVLNFNKVDFVSINENLDTATPMGKLMIGILSAFAQLERENIRERTRMGMKERVKQGYWPGGGNIPFGYDYDKNEGILVPNQDSAIVKDIFDLYIQGVPCYTIAKLTGLKYDKLIRDIIDRKTYTGIIEYNGVIYPGRHKAIIDKETYEKAKELRESKTVPAQKGRFYLLQGLMECGICGAKMRYQKWGEAGTKIVCYSSDKSKIYLVKDKNCNMPKFWSDDVEKMVLQTVFQLKEADFLQKEIERVSGLVTVTKTLEATKKKLENSIKKLYELYAASDDGDDYLLETIQEKKIELEDVKRQLEEELKKQNKKSTATVCIELIKGLEEKWAMYSSEEKQNIIRILVRKIIVYPESVKIILNI